MSSVLAVVAKAVFEKQAPKNAQLGQIWATDAYLSHHAKLEPLDSGGTLFLATVRPPDERLWLVAVLESPAHGEDGWRAAANVVPIADITHLLPKLRFDSGKGNTAEPGKLGMSLQTPRGLTEADVALLRGVMGPAATAKAGEVEVAKPPSRKPPPAKAAAAKAEPPSVAVAKPEPKKAPTPKTEPARIEGTAFEPASARAAYAARIAADLGKLEATSREAIEELCKAAGKGPKKALAAMKKLAASSGKKSAVARIGYDALALACLEKSAEYAGDAFGEARALGHDAKNPPAIAEEIATMRLFTRKQAIWGKTIVALLESGRLANASAADRAAFQALIVELAELGFEPRMPLTKALLAYDPAVAKAALVGWTREPKRTGWRDFNPAEWAAFGPVFGEAVAEETSVRRWLVTWRPDLRGKGWGQAWLELLQTQRVTEAIAEHEPGLLGEHMRALATIASYRGLMAPAIVTLLERAFVAAAPVMRAAGVSVDFSHSTREPEGWRPQYLDLPSALVLELLLAHDVPLRLPTPVPGVCLPLAPLGLPAGDAIAAAAEYRALRRVLALPVLRDAIVRMYEPAVNSWSDVHAHVRELDVDSDLGPVFAGLAAFVRRTADDGGLAAFRGADGRDALRPARDRDASRQAGSAREGPRAVGRYRDGRTHRRAARRLAHLRCLAPPHHRQRSPRLADGLGQSVFPASVRYRGGAPHLPGARAVRGWDVSGAAGGEGRLGGP